MDGIQELKAKYLAEVADAGDESTIETVRLAAVGKKGEV
ncbi:MAG: phenylalanine--tRNA ligase subunit alpha, partial [Rhodobacteraceae bacterium]|nr:phenylalanine--tRNA ligase subunit alpha [Paracoccaceae bacterium]